MFPVGGEGMEPLEARDLCAFAGCLLHQYPPPTTMLLLLAEAQAICVLHLCSHGKWQQGEWQGQ